ncbi:MAG: hypothetical protein AAFR66_01615, partial [Bacteroidota bacterium]
MAGICIPQLLFSQSSSDFHQKALQFQNTGNLDSSKVYFHKAISILKAEDSTTSLSELHYELADVYIRSNLLANAA